MDKYFKWIIFLVILLVVTVGLTVYFSFFYNPRNVGLSPAGNNSNINNSSNDSNGLTIDERGSKDFEKPFNSSPAGNNTNRSGYWIQELPDSGGALTITPLIIYDKLTKTKNWMVIIVIALGIVIYTVFKIRKKEPKKELTRISN